MRSRGFSVLELLVVVGMLIVISAIAVPNLVRCRLVANETAAAATIKIINSAEVTYQTTYAQIGFNTLDKFCSPDSGSASSNAAGLLDDSLCVGSPVKQGYDYTLTVTGTPGNAYDLKTVPHVVKSTGNRTFCSNQTGAIYFKAASSSTAASCTVGRDTVL